MIKKDYQKPTMNVVLLQHRTMLLSGSITDVNSGDTGIGYDGPGSGPARARHAPATTKKIILGNNKFILKTKQ